MTNSTFVHSTVRTALLIVGLTLLAGNAAWATYPGQNGRIAFVGHFTGTWQLYSVNPDGTDPFQITNLPPTEFFFWCPDYSPDGRRIAFSHDMSGAPEIYVINVDGTGLTQLSSDGTEAIFPRWSPDGAHITFSTLFIDDRFFFHHLVTIRDDGSDRKLVTNVLFDDYQATYTIDGKRLIFASTRDNLVSALWLTKPDGSQKKQLTAPALEGGCPDASPDGRHLAVCSQMKVARTGSIWVGNLDGSHLKRLTNPKNISAVGPVYSPDGSKIVFNGEVPVDAPFNMYIMNSDGSGLTLALSCPDLGCLFPDWGPSQSENGHEQSMRDPKAADGGISLSLSVAPNPATVNDPVTMIAFCSIQHSPCRGSVSFKDSEMVIGSAVLRTRGFPWSQAQFTTPPMAVGSHRLKAVYNGKASRAVVLTVNP
jgi:Tol biopolymer transport system component